MHEGTLYQVLAYHPTHKLIEESPCQSTYLIPIRPWPLEIASSLDMAKLCEMSEACLPGTAPHKFLGKVLSCHGIDDWNLALLFARYCTLRRDGNITNLAQRKISGIGKIPCSMEFQSTAQGRNALTGQSLDFISPPSINSCCCWSFALLSSRIQLIWSYGLKATLMRVISK